MLPAWTIEIYGDDVVVRNITATCFGGQYDAGDNGKTESGWNNTGDDSIEANTPQVALPIRSTEKATAASPLACAHKPHIPWLTRVMVWREQDGESSAVSAILTDNGPDVEQFPTHALDMNPPLALQFAKEFDPAKIANEWSGEGFSYRIIGGAAYVETP